MPEYYPAFIDIQGKRCLVVGGGSVAERKVKGLLSCGANVVVLSPTLSPALRQMAGEGVFENIQRDYASSDVDSCFLVIAATDDPDVNRQVYADAEARGKLANVVDDPEHCRFIVPSVLKRGSLTLAISTSGKSPALAKRIREELETIFPEEYAGYLEQMADLRGRLKEKTSEPVARERIWRTLMQSGLLDLVKQGKVAEAERLIDSAAEERP